MGCYPCIGHPPYNCEICGGRIKEFCGRHPRTSETIAVLIDKYIPLRAIRFMLIRLTHADTSARTIGIPEQSRSAPLEG